MKCLLVVALAGLASIALTQTWSDGKGLTAKYQEFKMDRRPNNDYDLFLAKNVSVSSNPQGLKLLSDTMQIHAVPDVKNPKSYLVQHAVAVGKVFVTKTVRSKTGAETTQIDGTKADYTSGVNESLVKMDGPMQIQSLDEQKHPTMTATSKVGVATLEPLTKSNIDNGLKKATLDGDVKLVLTQTDLKSNKLTTIRTFSDHMILENLPTGKRVTLTGSVRIIGDEVGDIAGAKSAVFTIAKNGDFHLETSRMQ